MISFPCLLSVGQSVGRSVIHFRARGRAGAAVGQQQAPTSIISPSHFSFHASAVPCTRHARTSLCCCCLLYLPKLLACLWPTYLLAYLPACLLPAYCLCLPTYMTYLLAYLPMTDLTYLPTSNLPTYSLTYDWPDLPTCLPTRLPTYDLPTCLPASMKISPTPHHQ